MNAPIVTYQRPPDNRSETRVMLLVADGVSLTTVSSTLEPFQQVNTYVGSNRFELQLVSLGDQDPTTQAGIPVPCHASSKDVLSPCDILGRPDLVILCCGQRLDTASQALLQKFIRTLLRSRIPFFALGSACEIIAVTGAASGKKCAAHWKNLASLEERFPETQFDNILFAFDERFTSCAGELAAFDLIVDFIEKTCGPGISGEICHHFLASGKRSGETLQFLTADAAI